MRRLLALLVRSGLVLAACGGGSVAATVDGTDIPRSRLDAMRPGRTAPTDEVVNDLSLLISTEILRNALADLGGEAPAD